jgi:hypothetical protein
MADTEAGNRKTRTLAGLAVIAFAILGAIASYVSDANSLDFVRMIAAKDYAILHLVLWTVVGLGIILWANRPPDDRLPFETNDGDRDGMR